jgi:hypothetical protein
MKADLIESLLNHLFLIRVPVAVENVKESNAARLAVRKPREKKVRRGIVQSKE